MALTHNHLTLLRDGTAFFPALLSAIAGARHSVWLETYIFSDDETGQRVAQALESAARRGVQVHLLVDGFGSLSFPPLLAERLLGSGVRYLVFRPELTKFSLRKQRLRRLHRKLALIDGVIGFVGGINIINDRERGEQLPRYDYAVRVSGPLCQEIARTMAQTWRRTCQFQLKHVWMSHQLPKLSGESGRYPARLIIRDNGLHRRAIETAYLEAIAAAKTEILIANAYFLPGLRFRHALLAAASRGVRVTLLLQGRKDQALLQLACRGLFGQLLAAGVRIVEYHRAYMHAKVAVIDGNWVTIGSSNIDPFSILLAKEANIVVEHPEFALRLRKDLCHELHEGGVEVKSETIRHRWWSYRVLPWFAYWFVRGLLGMTGYGREVYRDEGSAR